VVGVPTIRADAPDDDTQAVLGADRRWRFAYKDCAPY
jgi:hypothetical protein